MKPTKEQREDAARLTPQAARDLMVRLDQMLTVAAKSNNPVDWQWAIAQWNALNERANS